jgi:glycine cleavage system H protein
MYLFHRDHTWVKMADDMALIGLTFYAQAHLGEIVYVDLPLAGRAVSAGTVLAGIESAKTTSEIITPVSGQVIESNQALSANPALINESPMEVGWITKIRVADRAELNGLLELAAYNEFLATIPSED